MPLGTKNSVIAGCGVHHIAIQCRNMEESFRFYRDTLGMTLSAVFERPDKTIYLLDAGDGVLMELFPPPPQALPESPSTFPVMHIAFATHDARAAVERVRGAGYKVRVEPFTLELGGKMTTIAFVTGPSGEDVEFFQVHQE